MKDKIISFNEDLMYKCDILGTAFKVSVTHYKYDSKHFVKTIMLDKKLDWLFRIDDCQEWCDGYFLMSVFDHRENFKHGKCADTYLMWWLGYLYKYWMSTRGTSRAEIYKILPFERFVASFEFYHTQGWEYVIEDAIKTYKNKNFII